MDGEEEVVGVLVLEEFGDPDAAGQTEGQLDRGRGLNGDDVADKASGATRLMAPVSARASAMVT